MNRGRIKLVLAGKDYRDYDFDEVFPRPYRLFWRVRRLPKQPPRGTGFTFAVYMLVVAEGLRVGYERSAIQEKLWQLYLRIGANKHS